MIEVIKVDGMHCEHCEAKVNKAVLALEGVASASSNHNEGTCTVDYDDSKVSIKEIKKAIKKSGFKAK